MKIVFVATTLFALFNSNLADHQGNVQAPPNMLAWYDGPACPLGWEEYNLAQGQVLVATSDPKRVGKSTDELSGGQEWRLKGEKQPSHSHGYARQVCAARPFDNFGPSGTPTIVLGGGSFQSIETINCNTKSDSEFAASETSFPFAQLRLCKSQAPLTVPVGLVAHFSDDAGVRGCPSGWEPYFRAEGRTLRPKNPNNPRMSLPQNTSSASGSIYNGVRALDTSGIPENRMHQHGIETRASLAGPGGLETWFNTAQIGPNFNDASNGRDQFDFTGLSDAQGLNVPFVQMLACKATIPAIDLYELNNPPDGALMFFEDKTNTNEECPTGWTEASAQWHGKTLVALPDGENPKVWDIGSSEQGPSDHTHLSSVTIGAPLTTFQGISNIIGGDPFQYARTENLQVRLENVPSSGAFQLEWTACPKTEINATCNTGGGKVLARFGASDLSAGAASATNAGQLKYNYMIKDGEFICNSTYFGGDPSSSLADSCDFAPILSQDPFPAIETRFCRSQGVTGTIPPTATPTKAPTSSLRSPTAAPITPIENAPNECSADDAAVWKRDGQAKFDQDTHECSKFCGIASGSNLITVLEDNCLLECIRDRQQVERPCARCMADWLQCIAMQCPLCDKADSAAAGRSPDDFCLYCSQAICDDDFATCAGGNMFIPVPNFVPGPPNVSKETGNGALIGGICAAIAGAIFFGVAYYYRGSQRKELERLTKELQHYTDSSRVNPQSIASSHSSLRSDMTAEPLSPDITGPVRLKATFDFVGEFEDELSVQKHTILNGISRDGDWYYVENTRTKETGLVPCAWLARA